MSYARRYRFGGALQKVADLLVRNLLEVEIPTAEGKEEPRRTQADEPIGGLTQPVAGIGRGHGQGHHRNCGRAARPISMGHSALGARCTRHYR